MVVTSDGHYIKLRADLLRCRAILYTVPGEWCIKLTSDRSPEVIISVNKKAPAFDRDGGFAALLREPTCLVGVGNPLRRDDGVGPWIVGAVREAASRANLPVVDAQDVPENFVHSIARADCRNVVFIDAVAAEGAPGTVVFGPLASFAEARASRPTSSLFPSVAGSSRLPARRSSCSASFPRTSSSGWGSRLRSRVPRPFCATSSGPRPHPRPVDGGRPPVGY
jgi:hypothetical protein